MRFIDQLRRLLSSGTRASRDAAYDPSVNEYDDAAHEPSEPEDNGDVDPYNPLPEPIRLEIRDVIDLHTIAPRDVRRVVEAYLEEARRAGFRVVRIIHGKGIGVQRETVRGILSRTPFVEHFTDAPPEAGGWGATVARLNVEEVE